MNTQTRRHKRGDREEPKQSPKILVPWCLGGGSFPFSPAQAMIVGLGLDLCDGARVRRALARHPRMIGRVFTEPEAALCGSRKDPAPCFAARFAAKEAALKALGTGWSGGIGWRDVEVVRLPEGGPGLAFHGKALERLGAMGATRAHLTLTHEGDFAAAVVLLETP